MHDKSVCHRCSIYALYTLLVAGLLLAGLLLALLFTLPFSLAKPLADRLALDGTLDSFTLEAASAYAFLRYVGFGLLGVAASMLAARRSVIAGLARLAENLAGLSKTFIADARQLWANLGNAFQPRSVWLKVLGLSLLSALNKAVLLARPMEHDEAYTYIAFASRPLIYLLRDYHLPNNHVFHSLLAHLAINLFGIEPWFVRLPAFMAGVLLVPFAFLAGRAYYGSAAAGLWAAGAVALLPAIRDYASHARGYTLLGLAALVLFSLSLVVKTRRNTFAWVAWIFVAALGLYTLPIMLYPLGGVVVWLLISALLKDVSAAYRGRFLVYLASAVTLTGTLTALLYLPVMLYSGLQSLTANPFIRGLAWKAFIENLLARLNSTWLEWGTGVSALLTALLAGGFLLSWVFNRHFSQHRSFPPLAFLLWSGLLLLAQRVAPLPRIWFFALPLCLVFACGGLAGTLGWIAGRMRQPNLILRTGTNLVLLFTVLTGVLQLTKDIPHLWNASPGPAEQAALFLKEQLADHGDAETLVVIGSTDGPSLMYYFDLHGLSRHHLLEEASNSTQVIYIIANSRLGESAPSVLEASRRMEEMPEALPAEQIRQFGPLVIYQMAWR